MFDIGWSEMVVIALLTLIVIGPKELPRVLRTVGQWVRKAQSLAREFQRGLDEMAREADLEDAKKLLDSGRSFANPKKMVMDTLDPTGSVEDEARNLQSAVTADAPAKAPANVPADTPAGGTAEKAQESQPQTASEKEPAKNQPPKQQQKPATQETAKGKAEETNQETKQAAQATVVKQPVNVAPPHSLTPPSEPGAKAKAKKPDTEPASPDGSQNTA